MYEKKVVMSSRLEFQDMKKGDRKGKKMKKKPKNKNSSFDQKGTRM